jgi:hypothetical protein
MKIESSSIAGFEYDDVKKELVVQFKNGSKYKYFEVPAKLADDLENAESCGKFFIANIKNAFKYQKV